jgi:hypothetical protein
VGWVLSCVHGANAPEKFSGWQSEAQTDDHYACVREETGSRTLPLHTVTVRTECELG